MNSEAQDLRRLIIGMRDAYHRGENAMAFARSHSISDTNSVVSTLIAYDLQAGSYVAETRRNLDYNKNWCNQLAGLLQPFVESGDTILEVGVGEATTLAGVIKSISDPSINPMGFDVSWSRVKVANDWLNENSVSARLFTGDLFNIPLADNSIDVIYSSHSLEPNGGREQDAIAELLRVARKAVVLVEPIYELANEDAQKRMDTHHYVKGIKTTAERLGARVTQYGLLSLCSNPLNPSGVVAMIKSKPQPRCVEGVKWHCPTTGVPLEDCNDHFYARQTGLAYPVLKSIPLLRQEHAVLASALG
jgi:ubiquinone/menaquinone biosynthesis C-methylase UbiE